MAIQCSFCGSPLKDNARYCNQCGTLDASHPFSPKSSPAATVEESNKPGRDRREQIAQQPPARSSERLAQDEPPSWMSYLENGLRTKVPSGELESRQQEEPREDSKASKHVRELRVKVWEQEEPEMPAVNERITEDDLEDLPTRPLVADSPAIHKQRNAPSSTPGEAYQAPTDEVEYLDTVPLATQEGTRLKNTPLPLEETKQRQEHLSQQHFDTINRPRYQSFSTPAPDPTYPRQKSQSEEQRPSSSAAPLAEEWRQTPPSQSAAPSTQRTTRRKGRKLPPIIPVLLIVLVLSGILGTWIFVYQPFSVPGITQPQQSFSNTQLDLSLSYPNGWQSQVDVGKSTVHFQDTSHTAAVVIVVASASVSDTGAYLQQKANQLGMTGLQSSSTSFGGASWQQIRGNVLVRGASYTETLLATIHKNTIFTMMLLAPQTTYVQEDQLVFSKMRASFQFLS